MIFRDEHGCEERDGTIACESHGSSDGLFCNEKHIFGRSRASAASCRSDFE